MTYIREQIEALIKRLRFDSNDVCNAYSSTIAARIEDAADALAAQAARIDGLLEQHHKDSAELRNLCEARDQARRTAEYWKAEHNAGNARIAELERDGARWRTEMTLRNDPAVAIMFVGIDNRCNIYRSGALIASGEKYESAIDAAIAAASKGEET